MSKIITTSDFIMRSQNVHGDRYDYSKSVYGGVYEKIEIICKEHGSFWQLPQVHWKGCGCPACAHESISRKKIRYDTDSFIEKSRTIHGNKYDYSHTIYVGYQKKIKIICPIHGLFLQTPDSHLRGCGCPVCGHVKTANKQTSNTAEFIKKANVIHNNKYDYSKVSYIRKNIPITITCPIHGNFEMRPDNHLSGQGCPRCGKEKTRTKLSLSQEDFIARCHVVHNHQYDYSKTSYVNFTSKITIICPLHGEFIQEAESHLTGCGCPKCARQNQIGQQLLSQDEFIDRLKDNFGDDYDYSVTKYQGKEQSVKVICKRHGLFAKKAKLLMRGHGCPKCSKEKRQSVGEYRIEKFFKDRHILYLRENAIKDEISTMYVDFSTEYGFIEFDGQQHFNSIEWFGGNDGMIATHERDLRKNEYCKENNIPFVRIRFDQINEIEHILEDFISNNDEYLTQMNPYLSNDEYYSIVKGAV